ncbi:MAG: hypothetical protein MUF33_13715 [Candidatus Nanopelagicales bacterium]|jgi:hypothetical protein|nr:hypothetical protein [Candidatus Nanopelagicales bacterium]
MTCTGLVQPEQPTALLGNPQHRVHRLHITAHRVVPQCDLEGIQAGLIKRPVALDGISPTVVQGLPERLVRAAAIGVARLLGCIFGRRSLRDDFDDLGTLDCRNGLRFYYVTSPPQLSHTIVAVEPAAPHEPMPLRISTGAKILALLVNGRR